MAYKQSAFPMMYGSKKHKDATMAKQTTNEREEFEKEKTAEEMNKDAERKGKIVYKDGKKYYQASDGTLHTGQVEDYERELAIDKANAPNKQKKNVDKPVKPTIEELDKYSDLEKYDDDNPTGKAEPPKKDKKKTVEFTEDPITGGNNAEYETEYSKMMQMYKDGKITKEELKTKKAKLIARLKK